MSTRNPRTPRRRPSIPAAMGGSADNEGVRAGTDAVDQLGLQLAPLARMVVREVAQLERIGVEIVELVDARARVERVLPAAAAQHPRRLRLVVAAVEVLAERTRV